MGRVADRIRPGGLFTKGFETVMSYELPKTDRFGTEGSTRSEHQSQEKSMITNVAEPQVQKSSDSFPELSHQLEKDLVQIFKLLSDETRLRILLYLAREKELHVTALCDRLMQSQPAVSHHLALLRVAGLIEARRDGKHNYYSVRSSHFRRVMEELFQSISDPASEEVHFDGFTLTHA